jgi:hypothetical protein
MTGINVIPTILPLPLQANYLARDLDSSPFSLTENGDQPVMCEPTTGAAQAAPQFNLPTFNQESVRHILLGDYSALVDAINRMAVPSATASGSPGANPCPPGATANSSAS